MTRALAVTGAILAASVLASAVNDQVQAQSAYIANFDDNTVSVLDLETDTVRATIASGDGPRGVAISPDGSRVYVTEYRGDSVSILDGVSNRILTSIPVGKNPKGIAISPDGSKVFVANVGSNAVSVIDTKSQRVTASLAVGEGPMVVALSPDGSRLYVTHSAGTTLAVFDTASNALLATVPVGAGPIAVAVTPDGSRVLVGNNQDHSVTIVDAETNSPLSVVKVGEYPIWIAVSPDGSRAYVANNKSATLSVLDLKRAVVVATIPSGPAPAGVAVSPDGSSLYVPNNFGGSVTVISTADLRSTGKIRVGRGAQAFGQFIDPVRRLPGRNSDSRVGDKTCPDELRACPMPAELLQPHLVEVGGGRRLNFHCIGSGSPTIVFEQGGEGFLTNWKKVQPAATALTRTCFYDRAGFGYSDPPDKPVTGLNVTDDLHALLQRAGVTGQIVLVGHSIGGFYATLYADRFPDQVAGLVLVDTGFAGQKGPMSPEQEQRFQANNRRGEGYLLRCAEMARAGKLTRENLTENKCVPLWPGSTPDEAPYLLHAILRPHWHLAEHSQSVHYHSSDDQPSVSWRQEMEARRSFGDMPMMVLSADVYPRDPWETDQDVRDAQAHWQAGHKALATRSTRGRWSVVPGAGHFIQVDKPEAVVSAIQAVVAEVRRNEQSGERSR